MSRWLLVLLLALVPGLARADTACRLVSAPAVAFGAYDTLSPVPTDTLTNVRVSCERNGGPQSVTLTLRIGPGLNGTSSIDRRMRQITGGTDSLAYGLYRDVSRSAVWGSNENVDTVSQTLAVPNKGTQAATFTIYGRIPALQDVSAGTYGDRVAITLTP